MLNDDSTVCDGPASSGTGGPSEHPTSSDAARTPAPPAKSPLDFPPTRWTLVLEAAEGDDAKAEQAMAELCEHYRGAVQAYFRMKCRDPQAGEDLAGAFMLHLLERNRFRNFEKRENMRFRNYLSRALKFFLCDHRPEKPSEPIDTHLERAGEDAQLEKYLDAQLALTTHQRALTALTEGYGRHGKSARVERLRPYLFEDPEGDEYRRAAADLGLTINTLYQAVYRLRHDYYERFRAEIAQTVRHGKEELDEETRYLMGLLPVAMAQASDSRPRS